MTKGHITGIISEYIDGTLNPKLREKAKAHLFFCNHCRNILKETQDNVLKMKSLPSAPPPPELEDKIISAVLTEVKSLQEKKGGGWELLKAWFFSHRGLALAATAGLAVVFFNILPSELKRKADIHLSPVAGPKSIREMSSERTPLPTLQHDTNEKFALSRKSLEPTSTPIKAQAPPPQKDLHAPLNPEITNKPLAQTALAINNTSPADGAARNGNQRNLGSKEEAGFAQKSHPALWSEIKGDSSGINEAVQNSISDMNTWRRIWNRHISNRDPKTPLPPVNFDINDVLMICAGPQPTGGYSIDITRIETTEWEGQPARVVYYKIKKPPENSMKTMAITQPFIFRLVSKIPGTTFFKPAE